MFVSANLLDQNFEVLLVSLTRWNVALRNFLEILCEIVPRCLLVLAPVITSMDYEKPQEISLVFCDGLSCEVCSHLFRSMCVFSHSSVV